ncbi:LacI family DNA-binding transcriptional regulator [Adhaeribacter radiodurans]|uniref:LacI family DNA-binding transcriptional regulator n=1 Tax=Adhaeribacter radiodurans TaxID=2745197 RepID=A0A7L7LDK2_9BACT|nr:LacI family DNA-binding transcriptional regulator [Adhaeribacter radiodurans]QMU30479.1 LacI family DNA-binding transcriptional regulator [Adhaeribacter radiodurans]
MKNRPVTIKDIAQQLNISVSTVSRALRGSPDINADTKKAVLDLAAELDYQPNSIALSLVKSRTNILGVIIPDIAVQFFASAISGIQEVASAAGFNVMICQSNESEQTEINNIQALLSSRVAGLIVSVSGSTVSTEHFKMLQKKGIPLILFDRVCDDIEASKVIVDDYQGALAAVNHLIAVGCKRIAHLAGPEKLQITANRKNGYLDALRQNNIPVEETLVKHVDFDRQKSIDATNHWIQSENPPDGIFAISDRVAIGAMLAIKAAGLRIPQDIALVGFGNEATSSILDPALTTVMQYPVDMGRAAARLFLEQIEADPEDFTPQTIVLETKLLVNKSSDRSLIK